MVTFRRLVKTYWPTAVLIILAILAVGAWWLHSQPARTKKQLQTSRQVLLDAASTLQQLPGPSAIEPAQSGGTVSYQIGQLKKAGGTLDNLRFNPPSAGIVARLSGTPQGTISKYYSQGVQCLSTATQLTTHEYTVLSALQKTLEYNGSIDFKNFMAGSSDTNTRLQKAQDGIAKARGQLGAISLASDTTQDELVKQLDLLEQARINLTNDGNTGAWQQTVAQVQNAIIKNRQAYWFSQIGTLNAKLQGINNRLAHIQAGLR
ncbi:MAG TPA: hypothetical protein VFI84_00675 [Candidatus Saccharimonadales bacterium]|nr:hypothetical protein [Candidatus Saccharimonadales bacterium]